MTAARCPSTPAIVWKSGRKGKRVFNYWSWTVVSDEKERSRRRRRRWSADLWKTENLQSMFTKGGQTSGYRSDQAY